MFQPTAIPAGFPSGQVLHRSQASLCSKRAQPLLHRSDNLDNCRLRDMAVLHPDASYGFGGSDSNARASFPVTVQTMGGRASSEEGVVRFSPVMSALLRNNPK